ARAAGLKSRASARKSLTVAGAAIARFLAGAPEGEDASPGPEAIDLVAYRGTPRDGSEDGPWILHPELRAAVAAMRA
ncbi:hypothetical protein, partial [Roseicyclus sp.]|uniref:hypothetical protein n=1 Tax=Roseicyclus sp. TaxID=1914329 RepID=UPI003FA186FA